MINLLPYEVKEDITYARRNARLRNWIVVCIISLAGVLVIVCGGLLYMHKSINSYTKQVSTAQDNLKAQNVEETQKKVADISSSTKLATQVLSREILFSELIKKIGSTLPPGTVLKSLQIDKIQGGIQLNAGAKDFGAASQIQVNLQDPRNGVFEKADINNITCGETDDPIFPCEIELRALFSKDKSFMYITDSNSTTGETNR